MPTLSDPHSHPHFEGPLRTEDLAALVTAGEDADPGAIEHDLDAVVANAFSSVSAAMGATRAAIVFDAPDPQVSYEWSHDGAGWAPEPSLVSAALAATVRRRAVIESDDRPMVCVPMHLNGRRFAVVIHEFDGSIEEIDERHLRLLDALADTYVQLAEAVSSINHRTSTASTFEAAFGQSPAALVLLDHDGRIVAVNRSAETMLSVTDEEVVATSMADCFIAGDATEFTGWMRSILEAPAADVDEPDPHGDLVFDGRCNRHTEPLWVRLAARPIANRAGETTHLLLECTDISALKQYAEEIERQHHRFQMLLDTLPDPVVRVSRDRSEVFANQAAVELFGTRADGEIDIPRDLVERFDETIERVVSTGVAETIEFETGTLAGRRIFETRLLPELDFRDRTIAVIYLASDVTEQRTNEADLTHQATHDDLTGLPNRTLFASHVDAALGRGTRAQHSTAVAFLDLDRFKPINDSLGHEAGDRLLRVVAERISESVRPSDLVARLGGDEFVILLDGYADKDAIEDTVERIRAAIARPIDLSGQMTEVTASVGIAIADEGRGTSEELLRWADAAMYHAKSRGRARYSFANTELIDQFTERLRLEESLRTAFENEEFEVHYQPEVELGSGRVVGSEALLRWIHDGVHQDTPTFIDRAERTGLIVALGEFVLSDACGRASAWAENAGRFIQRINIGPRQFHDGLLVRRVLNALDESGLAAHRLCLEISESALMSDVPSTRRVFEQLGRIGVRVVIDDFGIGNSSLRQIRDLPLSGLKIHPSFVTTIEDEGSAAIVKAILDVGRSLGIQVIAEGVETANQCEVLAELGCNRASGYYFGGAMAGDHFTGLIGEQLPRETILTHPTDGTITTGR